MHIFADDTHLQVQLVVARSKDGAPAEREWWKQVLAFKSNICIKDATDAKLQAFHVAIKFALSL
jgi:hypothetical protein